MKKLNCIFLLLSFLFLVSCSSEENYSYNNNVVNVEVSFSGLDVSVVPDEGYYSPTRGTTTDPKVSRIAFKVFDTEGKEVYSIAKTDPTDNNFFRISCQLHVGTYTFVAVAHKARTEESQVATITSPTEASINEQYAPVALYTKSMNVTVAGNTSQNVNVDFGKRVTSSFQLHVTDTYPNDVEKIEAIFNPSKTEAQAPYSFNPATGLTDKDLTYTLLLNRDPVKLPSFTGKKFTFSFLLNSQEQIMDVTINMKNAADETIYTRTLSNVTFRQHCTTTATGTFFTSNVSGNFTFDTNDENINISLN